MNFIKNTLFYLLLLVFDVKTIVNEAEKLEKCVKKVATAQTETNESSKNLLKLIDQSTVILKAFCSQNLINFVDELEASDERKSLIQQDEGNDIESYDDYNDYYFYKTSEERKIKTLMTFTPLTVYKGFDVLRQLEMFNTQEYFLIKGQLNATLELDRDQRLLYQKKCYNDLKINTQERQKLNENHLIETQLWSLIPGLLIIFGKMDSSEGQSENRFVVKTSGIVQWQPIVENFVWNNLGWSSWGKWSPCSKSCKGIQQRYRQCLTNQQNNTNAMEMYEKDENGKEKSESASTMRQQSQQMCYGYNLEQRKCNLFECKDAANLLSLTNNTGASLEQLSAHINHDFTIMFTIRSLKFAKVFPFSEHQHLLSLRSTDRQSSLTVSLIENGMKVVQEKDSTSEMFAIKLNLFDLHWHQIALSFRSDGLIICYTDCNWDSSFVMAKGSFEVPSHPSIDLNSKLNGLIEWKQLNLIPGNHERSQCSNERTPIYDNNKLLKEMFNDESN